MSAGLDALKGAVNNLSTQVAAATDALKNGGTSDADLEPITAAIQQNADALQAALPPAPPPPPPAG